MILMGNWSQSALETLGIRRHKTCLARLRNRIIIRTTPLPWGLRPAYHKDSQLEPLMISVNIGDIVKEKGFHEGWDDEWQSWTVDEDRLLDYLEEVVNPEDRPANTGESLSCYSAWTGARGIVADFRLIQIGRAHV